MGIAFSRTTRALQADRGRLGAIAIWAALGLLATWAGWLVFGRVTVHEVSRAAHIEVSTDSREVATLQGGTLVASGLYVGRRVHAGDVLAELDAREQKLHLAQAEARLAGDAQRLAAMRRELELASAGLSGTQRAGSAELAAAQAQARAAQANAQFSRNLARKQQADSEGGGAAAIDAERAEADARRAEATHEASRQEAARAAGDAQVRLAEHAGDAARIRAGIAEAQAELTAAELLVAQRRYELDARKVRAPVDGVIGIVSPLRLGEVLAVGSRLATIVPAGDLHIVAAFDAATGLGRLMTGQTARLRLDGFSWTQYGDFPATVEQVAAEGAGNALRVKLRMPRRRSEDLPLRHGMTGQVDVAIETVSPLQLVLRAIGQVLA